MKKQFEYAEIERLRQTPEFEAMKNLLGRLNTFSNDRDGYLAALSEEHHTVQQRFFQLIQECILYMAEPGNVCIDKRNSASYRMCCKIAETVRNCRLPII